MKIIGNRASCVVLLKELHGLPCFLYQFHNLSGAVAPLSKDTATVAVQLLKSNSHFIILA